MIVDLLPVQDSHKMTWWCETCFIIATATSTAPRIYTNLVANVGSLSKLKTHPHSFHTCDMHPCSFSMMDLPHYTDEGQPTWPNTSTGVSNLHPDVAFMLPAYMHPGPLMSIHLSVTATMQPMIRMRLPSHSMAFMTDPTSSALVRVHSTPDSHTGSYPAAYMWPPHLQVSSASQYLDYRLLSTFLSTIMQPMIEMQSHLLTHSLAFMMNPKSTVLEKVQHAEDFQAGLSWAASA